MNAFLYLGSKTWAIQVTTIHVLIYNIRYAYISFKDVNTLLFKMSSSSTFESYFENENDEYFEDDKVDYYGNNITINGLRNIKMMVSLSFHYYYHVNKIDLARMGDLQQEGILIHERERERQ